MKGLKTISFLLSSLSTTLLASERTSAAKENKENNLYKRPNILFCIADDASFPHFSANGSKWVNTPIFDSISKHGVRFTNCYTANAKSGPARSTLLTGLHSWQLGEAGNHIANFPQNIRVITEVLAESGYDVAFTGKGWAPGNPGLDKNGQLRQLTGKSYQEKKLIPPTTKISETDYAENFKDFLHENANEKPWFFWFGSTEPHRDYEYGSAARINGRNTTEIDDFPKFFPDNDSVRTDLLDYGFEVEYFDKQLGRVIEVLKQNGQFENTIIIITSDNGMPFPRSKANSYMMSVHVPLAIMWKEGIQYPGRTVDDFINFVDFTPSFLELAQINAEDFGMKQPVGKSFVEQLNSNKRGKIDTTRNFTILGRERHDFGRPANQGYPIRSIIYNDLLYIQNLKPTLYPGGNPITGYLDCDGSVTKTQILNTRNNTKNKKYWEYSFGKRPSEELYQISTDYDCMLNLAQNENYKDSLLVLKNKLEKILKEQNDPRIMGNGDVFDNYPFSTHEKNAWNFWEKVVSGEIKEPWELTKWVNKTDYEIKKNKKTRKCVFKK